MMNEAIKILRISSSTSFKAYKGNAPKKEKKQTVYNTFHIRNTKYFLEFHRYIHVYK